MHWERGQSHRGRASYRAWCHRVNLKWHPKRPIRCVTFATADARSFSTAHSTLSEPKYSCPRSGVVRNPNSALVDPLTLNRSMICTAFAGLASPVRALLWPTRRRLSRPPRRPTTSVRFLYDPGHVKGHCLDLTTAYDCELRHRLRAVLVVGPPRCKALGTCGLTRPSSRRYQRCAPPEIHKAIQGQNLKLPIVSPFFQPLLAPLCSTTFGVSKSVPTR